LDSPLIGRISLQKCALMPMYGADEKCYLYAREGESTPSSHLRVVGPAEEVHPVGPLCLLALGAAIPPRLPRLILHRVRTGLLDCLP
jgi:hypothetical protein